MKTQLLLPALLAGAAALLNASCANSSHVLVYQHSTFGLNAAMNPATQSGHVRIGLRDETAIITPKLQPSPEEGWVEGTPKPTPKAASTYVASRYRVSDPFKAPEVEEIIATGNAATSVGKAQGSAAFLKDGQ